MRRSGIATLTNPYSPPEPADTLAPPRVSVSLRLFSSASFLCGFVAFMAYYGYPGYMNHSWYFGYLPALLVSAFAFAIAALALPWQPTRHNAASKSTVSFALALPVVCLAVAAALDATTQYGVFWLLPRLVVSMAASMTSWVLATRTHGTIRGRGLACSCHSTSVNLSISPALTKWSGRHAIPSSSASGILRHVSNSKYIRYSR